MNIWTYDLVKFTLKEVAVSEIRQHVKGAAAINGNKTYFKFELSEEAAKAKLRDYLQKEIQIRSQRLLRLQNRLNELLDYINTQTKTL